MPDSPWAGFCRAGEHDPSGLQCGRDLAELQHLAIWAWTSLPAPPMGPTGWPCATSCPAGSHPSPRRSNPMPPHATDCPEAPAIRHPGASPWEVADIFRLYGETYRRTHPVPPAQQQVMYAIEACRTAQLGGHAEHCPPCGFERYAYHYCRNRHCPECQTCTKVQWVEDRQALQPCAYR